MFVRWPTVVDQAASFGKKRAGGSGERHPPQVMRQVRRILTSFGTQDPRQRDSSTMRTQASYDSAGQLFPGFNCLTS